MQPAVARIKPAATAATTDMDSRLVTRVQLHLECNELPNLDLLSKTDAFVICFVQPFGRSEWVEIGRTEVVYDTTSPKFVGPITIEYRFEETQHLKFEVWDYDGPTKADFVGVAECPLGRIMGARGSLQKLVLARPGHSGVHRTGTITIRGDEIKGGSDLARLQFRCTGLDKKDWFGSSDPFITIFRLRLDGTRTKVCAHTGLSFDIVMQRSKPHTLTGPLMNAERRKFLNAPTIQERVSL